MVSFKEWLKSEIAVYHGSKRPINNWVAGKQRSGYYPGLYAWPDLEKAKSHGDYIYKLNIDPEKLYHMQNGDELKRQASQAGFRTSSGSGYQDVGYLKQQGYEGILRGREFIIFDPSKWSPEPELTF